MQQLTAAPSVELHDAQIVEELVEQCTVEQVVNACVPQVVEEIVEKVIRMGAAARHRAECRRLHAVRRGKF